MAQVLESEWKEVMEVQAEAEAREEKKLLPLDLLCLTYVFHLDGSDLGKRVEGGQEGPSRGGWRGEEIAAAGMFVLDLRHPPEKVSVLGSQQEEVREPQ